MRQTIVDIARAARVSTATVDRVLNDRDGRARPDPRAGCSPPRARSATCPSAAPAPDSRPVRARLRPAERPQHVHGPARRPSRGPGRGARRRGRGAGASRRRLQPRGAGRAACASCRATSDGIGIIALDHPLVREAIREVAAARHAGADPGLGHRRTRRASAMSASTTATPAGSPATCSAASCRARRARSRCSPARSAIAATRSARWAFATSSPRSSRACGSSSCARSATISSAATARPGACSPTRPELRGIYNIGAGNRGIAQALEEAGRAREIVFIGHELTEHTRRFLLVRHDGRGHRPEPAGARRARRSTACCAPRRASTARTRSPIRIHAIFRENMPEV